jgi:thiamine-monophosphate kinase
MIGVSGKYGHPPEGMLILLGKAKTRDSEFEKNSTYSVLEPRARLDAGLKLSKYFTSCIDSSDGLAISLYHLAESSKANFELSELPMQEGLEEFAEENELQPSDLVLFGGEEYELVCTFNPKYEKIVSRAGIISIGRVKRAEKEPRVYLGGNLIPRKGWLHFQS